MTISIELKEDLDAAAMTGLKETIESLAQSQSDVEFDLSKVQFIDSSGVGGVTATVVPLRNRRESPLRFANSDELTRVASQFAKILMRFAGREAQLRRIAPARALQTGVAKGELS